MNTKEKMLEYIKQKQIVNSKMLTEHFGISRQAIHKYLKEFIQQNLIIKEGSTRGANYRYIESAKDINRSQIKRSLVLKDLEEDKVFQEVADFLKLRRQLGRNALDIARYSFTEMLNNAIDHSHAEKCEIHADLDAYSFHFKIRDFGLGIFYSIFEKFNLADEYSAIGELLKGKTTTMGERHAGEGVFFTSKAGDTISFQSHKTKLIFDTQKQDVFVEENRFLKGTEVLFSLKRKTKRRLEDVFNQYAPAEFDYRFDRTRVQVKLFQQDYVSRSEAKRLLYGLDRFKEIILDFNGVKSIGQGFADEIFRVFKSVHPDIAISTENLKPGLASMMQHVVDNKISNWLTIS